MKESKLVRAMRRAATARRRLAEHEAEVERATKNRRDVSRRLTLPDDETDGEDLVAAEQRLRHARTAHDVALDTFHAANEECVLALFESRGLDPAGEDFAAAARITLRLLRGGKV